ncbi:electron transfer flavoprotein subunit beta/FixA family protein [Agromyces sp. MMS24-JH15]|uniref:electron transfer flavoprotein subunit beta/FixA family protein n=1 Tax=Agromyces sp. MMS24-JH15 TaxID=3243765 RepID=UPI003747CDE9
MKILVLVKDVPDTYGERRLDLETGLADRESGEHVLDEIGERALEAALRHADGNPGTEVVVLSMAPESAATNLRKALAMGAASAVHVADASLAGADLGLTADVLAAAVQRTGFDLVLTGNLSTDGSGGVLPSMLAERLGVPGLTSLSVLEIGDGTVAGERVTDTGTMRVSAALPAVASITEALPDPRFATFKGIMAAKKKPVETLSATDLGVDPEDLSVPRSILVAVAERPARSSGVKIADEGDAGERLAEFLAQNRLV